MEQTVEPKMLEERLLVAARIPAPLAGALVALAIASSYGLMALALGLPLVEVAPGGDPRFEGNAWSACVVSALLGFVFAGPEYLLKRNGEDVEALARSVPGIEPGHLGRRWREAALDRAGLRRATLLGALLGFGTWCVPLVRHVLPNPTTETVAASTWFLFTVPTLYIGFLRAAFVTASGMQNLPRDLAVDVLDPRALAPFARIGLRNAITWMLAGSLLMGLAISIPWNDLWTTFPGLVCIVAMAVAALVMPVMRARAEILQAKRDELERTDVELRQAVSALRAGDDDMTAAARVQGVAAWRAVVVAVNEWPVDAPTIVRFTLYLVIPVLGWLAGALVERSLDAFLD